MATVEKALRGEPDADEAAALGRVFAATVVATGLVLVDPTDQVDSNFLLQYSCSDNPPNFIALGLKNPWVIKSPC